MFRELLAETSLWWALAFAMLTLWLIRRRRRHWGGAAADQTMPPTPPTPDTPPGPGPAI